MARTPRVRRETSAVLIALLTPVLRYSTTRDAYVLRAVGDRRGPVLRRRMPAPRRPR